MMPPVKPHFSGLDTLRFLAALFVVLGHVPMNQSSVGLPSPEWGAAFYRGHQAVCFFFTLSGFLITYLLLEEHRRHATIDVGRFYLRRICRIWPLYFAVVLVGLTFYNALLPRLGIPYPVEYSLGTAALLYAFFLPNLMNSLYTVGGILNPLWSIGIEEQFYLAWAPLVKRIRERLPWWCLAVAVGSLVLFLVNVHGLLGGGWTKMFFGQLKFHFMALGALWAWALHRHRERLLEVPVFRSRPVQAVLLLLLVEHYILGRLFYGEVASELLQIALYGWLIVTVAANPRNLVRLAHPASEYFGRISYGIYMLHMLAVYATSKAFLASDWWHGQLVLYTIAYYAVVLTLTAALAALSYHAFERPFLRLKDRFSPLDGSPASPAPATALPVAPPPASSSAA